MRISDLVLLAEDSTRFATIDDYISFCRRYLEFIASGLQAVIVAQNETNYNFYQYRDDGYFNVTRPINADLMYTAQDGDTIGTDFPALLKSAGDIAPEDGKSRAIIRNSIYTIQQSIAATLDALPPGKSNTARKINGHLFERLIRLLINHLGVECTTGVISVPVTVAGETQLTMNYQHDLLITQQGDLKVIGSVKTSSKDRIDKVFLDKLLYNRLSETDTPHIAVFLNDVQRSKNPRSNRYRINSTFLPGHFKTFTLKLISLDGVYYCDMRPNMQSDPFLSRHIKSIDWLFCSDLQAFLETAAPAEGVTVLKESSAALDYEAAADESQTGFTFR
jgi:hypothetical protein